MKVFIGTPSYDRTVPIEYMRSMIQTMTQLNADGVEVQLAIVGGDCFVDHARNQIIDTFMAGDCTDLVMIDADQGWDVDNLRHLLARPEPVVAGVVIGREDGEKWHVHPVMDSDGNATMELGMLEVETIGAAFIRIKREAIEQMLTAYPEDYYLKDGRKVPALFKTEVVEHDFVGEDIGFCRKWRALGGKLYVMPDMTFRHIGRKAWTGNYYEHLQAKCQPKESSDVLVQSPAAQEPTEPTPETDAPGAAVIEQPNAAAPESSPASDTPLAEATPAAAAPESAQPEVAENAGSGASPSAPEVPPASAGEVSPPLASEGAVSDQPTEGAQQ